jgi:predicted phage terminase large subunit-like protein
MSGVLITQAKRREYRAAIKQLFKYVKLLEDHFTKGRVIPTGAAAALVAATNTTDPAQQLKAMQAMHADLDAQYDEELRYAAQFKLSPFCEFMYRDEVPAQHHELLIDYMEAIHNKDLMRLCISAPPGSAKSSFVSIRFPAWHLGRRPNDRWLQGAHTQGFAKDRLGKPVRSLIQEARYLKVFPEMALSGASSAADYFEFANSRGYYKAIGVGQGISGYRADIGGIDDPIASREDAESPTILRKLWEWFQDDFGTRPMPGSPIYVVATRWSELDLTGRLLDAAKENKGLPWEIVNIPALAEEDDILGRAPGEGLWPEMFGTEFYMEKKRSLTSRSWNSLYMGKPTDEDGGVLKGTDIHRYKTLPANSDEPHAKAVIKRITLSVDCAEKATQRSDFTAATVWIETTDKKHYLAHAARTKKEFSDMVEWIEHIARTWDVNSILVEDRGAGTQYIQVRSKKPGPAPVIGIATKQQSKEFRFDGVTPMFSAGEVLLPESGVDWIADLEAELLAFPNGKNDDWVDSVSQYLAHARERTGGRRGTRKIRSGNYR